MKNISQGNVISTSHFIVFYLQTVYQQSVHKLGMDEWVTRVVVLEYKGVNTECSWCSQWAVWRVSKSPPQICFKSPPIHDCDGSFS